MKLGKVAHRARFLFLAVQAVLCRCETAQWLYMNRALSDCLFGFLLSSPFKDVYSSPDRPTLFRLLPRCFPGFLKGAGANPILSSQFAWRRLPDGILPVCRPKQQW